MNTIGRLFESRKFVVALVAMVAVIVLAALDQLADGEALKFIERITMVWLGAHALEEGLAKR